MSRVCMIALVLAGAGMLGCGGPSPPDPSDPEVAKATLTKALEAWKRGEPLEAYKQSEPSVTVVDRQWMDGYKLLAFEIGESVPDGFDVQFKAKLDVQDRSGKPSKAKAVYNVSTTPKFVIVRAME